MLIYFIEYLKCNLIKTKFLNFLILRSFCSFFTSLSITLITTSIAIIIFKKYKITQKIKTEGPSTHRIKKNTPTMGGILIIVSILTSTILWNDLNNKYIWYIMYILISYGIVGLIDDFLKISKKNTNNGLILKWKYFWLSINALAITIIMYFTLQDVNSLKLIIPFFKNITPYLGFSYIPLAYLTIIGTSNAANLTDGLDGLVIVPIMFITIGLTVLAWITSDVFYESIFNVIYIKNTKEIIIICTSIIGTCLGFLWFNSYPAQIFMGDTGSLALGGTLGIITVILRQELLLIIMGGFLVLETISVILQIIFIKIIGKKIFLMAPLHHHYELKGYKEPKIIVRCWIISLILVIIGIITLKVY